MSRSRFRVLFSLGVMLAALPLGGCPAIVLGGAAAGGYTLATAQRSPTQIAKDASIAAVAHKYWADTSTDLARDVSATVYNSQLLITGTVPNAEMKAKAEEVAKHIEGVGPIYNEIQVGQPTNFGQDAKDGVVSNTLRAKLLSDSEVRSSNFTTHTLNGVVYLIGYARNAAERQRVVDYARNLSNVSRVVAYIEVGNEVTPPTGTQAPPSTPPEDAPPPRALPRDTIEVTPLQ